MEYQVLKPGDELYPARLGERYGTSAPDLYYSGPLRLLKRFSLGVLCTDDIPAAAFIAANQAFFTIIKYHLNFLGGWQSFYESESFRLGLHFPNLTVTCVSSKGLAKESFDNFLLYRFYPPGDKFPERPEYFRRAKDGELLMLSIADPKSGRMTKENILKRNFLVAALSDLVFIPYAEKNSKTMLMSKEIVSARIPCFTTDDPINQDLLDMGIPGFNRKSVTELLDEMGAPQKSPDEAEEVPSPPVSQDLVSMAEPPEKKPEQLKLGLTRAKP